MTRMLSEDNNPFYTDPDLKLDQAHQNLSLVTPLGGDVWREKYKWREDNTVHDTFMRVANAIFEDNQNYAQQAYWAMCAGVWVPAGRILAGAGTTKRVTLMNCYVSQTMEDSMDSIMETLGHSAFVLQQGGGIGTDFSTLRPKGAKLERTGSAASGPIPFMDMWHAMSDTIMSAGHRRGAMMGTMCDTHPDLPKFIEAKHKAGRLTNFNVSILVSDALMEAVREDADWLLHFHVEPLVRDPSLAEHDFQDETVDGRTQYVYQVIKARDLWEMITKSTYEYSEPGVIFVDRINEMNNLYYCEEIRCTNPCGEQPLPPFGTCNLGAINLARLVRRPFTDQASFNFEALIQLSALGMRFLDNVIDVTRYPLEEQQKEEFNKRRTGLGITGLGDALAQMKLRYGSIKAADMAEKIMWTIAESAYSTSVEMAKEKGAFPLYDIAMLSPNTFVGKMMPDTVHKMIQDHGIRNGVLLTIAPTGTTSLVFGDGSSGVEPEFAHVAFRKKVEPDGSMKEYKREGYCSRLYHSLFGESADLPSYMVTSEDLTIGEHVLMQSRVQRWVDASVSKTINCPKDMTYEEFTAVYEMAYNQGCKGCTTYRPSDVRGSILSKESTAVAKGLGLTVRPDVLQGKTYKIKWPRRKAAVYVTINNDETGRPYEVFITSKDGAAQEWTTALSLMITAIFRTNIDVSFVSRELQQISSFQDSTFLGGKYYASLPAYLGHIIDMHLGLAKVDVPVISKIGPPGMEGTLLQMPYHQGNILDGEECPECHAPTLTHQEGCKKCHNCGYSSC